MDLIGDGTETQAEGEERVGRREEEEDQGGEHTHQMGVTDQRREEQRPRPATERQVEAEEGQDSHSQEIGRTVDMWRRLRAAEGRQEGPESPE